MTETTSWKAKPHRPEYDVMRERLIAAGWELACARGVKRMTLNAVAREADCARSSVYRYFDSKEQLLGAILQERIYALGVELDEQLKKFTDPVEQLVQGLYLAIKAIKSGPSLQLFQQLGGEEGRDLMGVLQQSLPEIASDMLRIDPVFARAREGGLVRNNLSDKEILSWLVLVGTALLQQDSFGSDPRVELPFLRKMLVPSIFNVS